MTVKKRIVRAYATSLAGLVSGLLTNLWMLREVTHRVSPHDFGVYALVLQTLAYLGVLQLGLDFAAAREIAEQIGRGDMEAASHAYRELRRLNAMTLGAFSLALIVTCAVLGHRYGFPSLAVEVAGVAGLSQVFVFFARPYSSALIGSQQQATVNIVSVARTISVSLIAVPLVLSGLGVMSIAIAELTTQAAAFVAFWRLAHLRSGWITHHSPSDPAARRAIFRFGALSTVSGFATTIEFTCDVFFLASSAGATAVGSYVLWWRIPQMLFDICHRLSVSVFPSFAEGSAVGTERVRQLFSKVAIVSMGLGTLACVGVGLWLPSFVRFWIGAAYARPDAARIATLMGILICLRAYGNAMSMMRLATGKVMLPAVLSWIQAGVKLSLGFALVRILGLAGLLIASCAATSVQIGGTALYLYREKALEWPTMLKAITLLVLAAIALMLLSGSVMAWTLPTFALGILITGAAWGIVWAAVAVPGETAETLRRFRILPSPAE